MSVHIWHTHEHGYNPCRGYSTKAHVRSVQPQSIVWFFPFLHDRCSFFSAISVFDLLLFYHHTLLLVLFSLLLSFYDFTNGLKLYMKNFTLLNVQSAYSKNYTEVNCSSASSRSYTFQNVRISRQTGLNMISQDANVLLCQKRRHKPKKIVIFLWFLNVTMQFLLIQQLLLHEEKIIFNLLRQQVSFLYSLYA